MRLSFSEMLALYKIPKVQMAFCLGAILASAFFHFPSWNMIISSLAAILSCLIFDFIFWKIRKIPPFLPSAAVVTGLIIVLLTDPNQSIFVPILISALAMAGKNFLKIGSRHIFNPAALGLFLGGLIFQTNISWWAVSFQTFDIKVIPLIYFVILISPLIVSIIKMKRFKITISFLIVYGLVFLVSKGNLGDWGNVKTAFLDPTVLFFGLVMLPEPKTSPNDDKWQIIFGVAVAILAFLFSQPFLNFGNFLLIPDPLITALLVGNLVFFR